MAGAVAFLSPRPDLTPSPLPSSHFQHNAEAKRAAKREMRELQRRQAAAAAMAAVGGGGNGGAGPSAFNGGGRNRAAAAAAAEAFQLTPEQAGAMIDPLTVRWEK